MKRYEKPFLTVTRFTTQETIANAYETVGDGVVSTEEVKIGDTTYTNVPVTTFNITSLGSGS